MTEVGGRSRLPRARLVGEDGAGTVGSIFGVAAFLLFVLFVAQTALFMFTASVVQTAALDAAAHAAGADQDGSPAAARQRAEAVLGGLAPGADVSTRVLDRGAGPTVEVTVSVASPVSVVRGLGAARIRRSAQARLERLDP